MFYNTQNSFQNDSDIFAASLCLLSSAINSTHLYSMDVSCNVSEKVSDV